MKILKIILIVLIIIYSITLVFHQFKSLPEGVFYESQSYYVDEKDISFLYDFTHNSTQEHEIFDEIFDLIDNAERFIIIDMFLFNNDFSNETFSRNITDELTKRLVSIENITIVFTTDYLNTFYKSYTPEHIKKLKDANVSVVFTDMHKLRDSNYLYSAFWRMGPQWLGNSQNGWNSHPMGNEEHEVTIRSLLNVVNAKANHRKLIVADNNDSYTSIITSANPHTASSDHSNVAFKINNSIAKDIIYSEKRIVNFSTNKEISFPNINTSSNEGSIEVTFLTEKKIKNSIINDIKNTSENDSITLAMFYLSDRDIINALKKADDRNVSINLILDPNKDAFGREKGGIPNRQVAYELNENTNASIYWYDTQGEQFHSKMIVIEKNESKIIVHLGSSNLTRRNLDNYNLEANVRVDGNITQMKYIQDYIHFIGNYTLDYEIYKDHSKVKYWFYRFQEFTGMSTY